MSKRRFIGCGAQPRNTIGRWARIARCTSQHAWFARLQQLEATQSEGIAADHLEHVPVAVIARLDAVEGVSERGGKLADVGKITQTGLLGVSRYGQRVLRPGQIRTQNLNRAVVDVGFAVPFLRRHPVTHEYIDVLVFHRGIGHRYRQHRDPTAYSPAARAARRSAPSWPSHRSSLYPTAARSGSWTVRHRRSPRPSLLPLPLQ